MKIHVEPSLSDDIYLHYLQFLYKSCKLTRNISVLCQENMDLRSEICPLLQKVNALRFEFKFL